MRPALLLLLVGCYSPAINKDDAGGADGPSGLDAPDPVDGAPSCPGEGVAFADRCFTPQTPIMLPSAPIDLDARDFDGDSKFDPVVRHGGGVVAYTNAGLFSIDHVGLAPIEAGILRPEDSYDDVALVDTANDVVWLYPGGATGFGAPSMVSVHATPTLVAFGDLDGQVGDDLLVASLADVRPYLWNEGLTAWEAGSFLGSPAADAFALGDYTVVAAGGGDLTSWRRGTLTVNATLSTTGQVDRDGLVAADLDGDGDDDVVRGIKTDRQIVVLEGMSGTYGVFATYEVGPRPTALALDDLDGDSDRDLVVVSHDDPRLTLLAGTEGLAFVPVPGVNLVGNPQGVAVADFNGDTFIDFAIATTSPSEIVIYLGALR